MNAAFKSFATVGALCAFTGFTSVPSIPNDVERCFIMRKEYYTRKVSPTFDECWSKFLGSLRSLDAVVYVPENKRAIAERYGIIVQDEAAAAATNESVRSHLGDFVSVMPGDNNTIRSCDGSVRTTFQELGMIVLVQKSRTSKIEAISLKQTARMLVTDASSKDAGIKQIGNLSSDGSVKPELAHKEEIHLVASYSFVKQTPTSRLLLIDGKSNVFIPASKLWAATHK